MVKLRKIIYTFKNLANLFDFKKNRIVYQALVESIINYGITIWGGAYDTTFNPLKIIQNKIMQIILKKNHLYHTKYLYKELNVFPLKKLFYKASVIYIIKNNLTSSVDHGYCVNIKTIIKHSCSLNAQKTNTIYLLIHRT